MCRRSRSLCGRAGKPLLLFPPSIVVNRHLLVNFLTIGTCNSLIKGMVAIIDLFGVDKAMVLLFYCKMSANSLNFPNTQT